MSINNRVVSVVCVPLMLIAMLGLIIPEYSYAKNDPQQGQEDGLGLGTEHRADPCDHLPHPPGNANGIDKICPPEGSSSGVAKGDFNGDGFADLAIGVPGEDTPATAPNAGAVIVIYGSATGLTAGGANIPASQFWSQNAAGVPGASESGDRFGSALAAGDFNGDGMSDLAIGIPGEDIAFQDSGRVVVVYGSPQGLAASGPNMVRAPQSFDLVDDVDVIDEGANLGSALAWGDFNGDGVGDLAIGAPGLERVTGFPAFLFTQRNAGGVWVLFGQPNNGLTLVGNQLWTQENSPDSLGTDGSSNPDDLFGAALAAGNFNGDFSGGRPISDLAIGVPGESQFQAGSISHAGRVVVLFGVSGTGLAKTGVQSWSQDSDGIVSLALANERFGLPLAAGDFNGDKKDDLAIGVPGQALTETLVFAAGTLNVFTSNPNAGAVHIIPGSNSGLTANGSQFWNQSRVFGDGVANDRFGLALAAGDFNADGKRDLAVGVPGKDVGSIGNAGEVNVIYGSSDGLSTSAVRAPQRFRDSTLEAGAQFGRSLTAWNFGLNETRILPPDNFRVTVETADLAIGVPFKDVNSQTNAGEVNVFYGSSSSNGLTSSSRQIWTQASPGVPGSPESGDNFGLSLY
jgi:FG-GAP repeat